MFNPMTRFLLILAVVFLHFQVEAQTPTPPTQDEQVLERLISQLQLQHKIMCVLRSTDVAKNATLKSACDDLLAAVVKHQKELAGSAK